MRNDAQPGRACAELLPELRSALAVRSVLEWEQLFGERVPCAAVRRIEDMFDHRKCSLRISSQPSIIPRSGGIAR